MFPLISAKACKATIKQRIATRYQYVLHTRMPYIIHHVPHLIYLQNLLVYTHNLHEEDVPLDQPTELQGCVLVTLQLYMEHLTLWPGSQCWWEEGSDF